MTRETNNPNQTFDFDKIGKRMPYTIPDNYFDRMEQHVWEEIRHEQKKRRQKLAILLSRMNAFRFKHIGKSSRLSLP